MPLYLSAEIQTGTTGDCTWTLDTETGVLTISGIGKMEDYPYDNPSPFNNNKSIETVIINNGVTYIGDNTFAYCSNLTSITIPKTVTLIGYYAFDSCNSLNKVVISDIESWCNMKFQTIGSNPLCQAHHLYNSNNIEITNLVIPNSITSVNDYAFYGCTSLISITIPNSVISIGDQAFSQCPRINTIYSLNPTPPSCFGIKTFSGGSMTAELRDKYDVYNYATLHVPKGCEEAYSSAYEWRYFNKIKEDMEMDGKVYYANLTVKQGTTGYTRQAIKADESYTIYIGSLGDNVVNAVTFNGKDVTDEVVNGYYTTPKIKGESYLSISFEVASDVKDLESNNIKVIGYDGAIQVTNIDEASDVYVYTTDGKLVESIHSAFGDLRLNVPDEQLYIIKVGNRTFKLAL